MEHTRITPPAGAQPLPPEMLDTFAHHGLRELLFAPIPKVARALAGFDRDQLGVAIEVMIAMLDAADGDPDAEVEDRAGETIPVIDDPSVAPTEDDGDPDLEEAGLEDSFVTHHGNGPGCPVSDAGEADGDERDTNNAEDELTAGVDPGFGSRGAGCSLSDGDGDRSYAEWQTLPASRRRSGAIDGQVIRDWGQGADEEAEDDDRDSCLAADDQGMAGGRWFDTGAGPGDPADAEDDHDREAVE